MLSYWLEHFAAHGVTRVLVNSHHLHDKMVEFVGSRELPVELTLVPEPILLGSAGTLRANRGFVQGEAEFFVAYADTLTNANLTSLLSAHRRGKKLATLGLFQSPTPSQCGIAVMDDTGTITDFEEKPSRPRSPLSFGGIMVASPQIFDEIPAKTPCDIGKDVLGHLVGKMAGWEIDAYVRDIGTPAAYESAQGEARALWSGR
jgi:mannose-1-phosphate guanylyltransferase